MKTILFILAWTVTFLGFGDKLLGTAEVKDGSVLTQQQIPDIPMEYCYKTLGWNDPTAMETEITANTTFYALYSQLRYSLSIDNEHMSLEYGSIRALSPYSFDADGVMKDIPCGETVTVYATPDNRYTFVKWVLNGTVEVTASSTLDILMARDTAIYAVFEVDPATDITNANADINAYKRIENNHVVIIRNNEKYDVTGKKL